MVSKRWFGRSQRARQFSSKSHWALCIFVFFSKPKIPPDNTHQYSGTLFNLAGNLRPGALNSSRVNLIVIRNINHVISSK